MTTPPDPSAARYARQRILPGFGEAAQRRLAGAHAVVIGAGGLGSAVLPILAAAGVGTITVVDDDLVDQTNLHRQILHGATDVGRPKVDSAADAVRAQSPETTVIGHRGLFTAATAGRLLAGADILIDGSDTNETRFAANDAAVAAGIPLVWGSALRWSGQVGIAWGGTDYRDLFPDGPDSEADTCEVAGILPTVCTVIGGLMATEAIKLLTGIGEPLVGRVILFDALTGTTRELRYERDPARDAAPLVPPPARAPASDRSITARELSALLSEPIPPVLLDVREPHEVAAAALPGAIVIPLGELDARIGELDPAAPTIVFCHLGVRSETALQRLEAAGFARARHLAGGIDAWSRTVDPSLPRY
ncbi:adenylyltransferase and sulfurtransferase [Microbacterium sp. cf046]|uniref:ThiF family adenylyltransferase n=1 Tax=Microbacterium sp. cf046 TaxID=1761803 RepID=UPI0008E9BDAC|nr:ThiF family adenylyltransferase [Microbacterium sp. cf046]SFS09251.1 adenylyltransferase and sulfurtransferase [Microbacterium sp. cf046]